MSKEILEGLNNDLNDLNIKIGVSNFMAKDPKSKMAIQTLKNSMSDAQSKFVKDIEDLFYN